MKQIKFVDLENDTTHGGIKLDNGDVICCCCGSLIPAKEFGENGSYEILEEYKDWVDLTESIIS
jgi:hypothetical protein